MMKRLPQLIIIFLDLFLTASASDLASAHHHASVKSIFAFGDSQFDPGNNQYVKNCTLQANFRPYGSSFFHHPTGRFTNGRTVVDFVSQFLGIKFQKPYQQLVHEHRLLAHHNRTGFPTNGLNFASAGSGLLRDTNDDAKVTPLQVQLQQFYGLIAHKHLHRKQIRNSFFFLVSGANDLFSYFLLPGASKMTPETYIHAMLKEAFQFTRKIYKLGGRKIVLFSIGPMGCIPGRVLIRGSSTRKCIDDMDKMAGQYNAGLKRFAHAIPKMFPGAIGVYAAVYDTAQKYRDNPKTYGFANIAEACCGAGPLNGLLQCGLFGYKMCMNPNQYFFWDYFHPTEHTYGLIAKAFWAGDKEEISPVNLKTLAHSVIKPFP